MPKKTTRTGKTFRLDPDATAIVCGYATLTTKSESAVASLFVKLTERMTTHVMPPSEVQAYLASLAEVARQRRLAAARIADAQRAVPALLPVVRKAGAK